MSAVAPKVDPGSRQQWKRLLVPSLIPIASFAVHQLRYLLAYGSNASKDLAQQGHGYFDVLTPFVVIACGLALGVFLLQMAGAWRTGQADERRPRGLIQVWLVAAIGLLAIYTSQELIEGLLANGHPTGLFGAFGQGGLWAIPACLTIGLMLALAARATRTVVALIARRRRQRASSPTSTPFDFPLPSSIAMRQPAPLAGLAAGRAPPPRLA